MIVGATATSVAQARISAAAARPRYRSETVDQAIVLEGSPARRGSWPIHRIILAAALSALGCDDGLTPITARRAREQFAHACTARSVNRVVGVGRAKHDSLRSGRTALRAPRPECARVGARIENFHHWLALEFGEIFVVTSLPVLGHHHVAPDRCSSAAPRDSMPSLLQKPRVIWLSEYSPAAPRCEQRQREGIDRRP